MRKLYRHSEKKLSSQKFSAFYIEQNTPLVLDRFHEIELEKTLDSITSVQNRRAQLGAFFGTADLAALSIAFSSEKAGLVVFAGILLWLYMYFDLIERSFAIAYYYKYIHLAKLFLSKDQFIDIFFSDIFFSEEIKEQLLDIINSSKPEEKIILLRKLSRNHKTPTGFHIPLVGGIAQITLGFILAGVLNWQLF